ncbi:hypothetical protein NDU88_006636 [Pleurodeles waltl]|uniref:Uncharacterized protein n=1 Tax=Pleurodeles waltl TaxID=8319 RepID=A0AAV7PLI6_PLEWA|nr:hypothetical protein NDU88_006636 [Pleurodeles waltl]
MKGRVFWVEETKPTYILPILLNGKERIALVDSGCSQSVIRKDLVEPRQDIPQTQVLITCVHGDQAYYPMATIMFQWRGEEESLRVGVLPHLEEDIIIGTDYTAFTELLSKAGEEHMLQKWWEEVPYDPEVPENQSPKDHLNKRQKRIQRQQYWEKPCESKETTPGAIGKNHASQRQLKEWDRPLRGCVEGFRDGHRRNRRRSRNSGGRGTRTIREMPGPVADNLGNCRSPESSGFNSVERISSPGEHTNEPATLQEKRGQARYGNSGRGGRSGWGKKTQTLHIRGGGGRKPQILHMGGEGRGITINSNTGIRYTESQEAELRKYEGREKTRNRLMRKARKNNTKTCMSYSE